jgi:hypothetical protein
MDQQTDFSKTNLICFTEVKHARMFQEQLAGIQEQGGIIERCSDGINSYIGYVNKQTKGSKLPLGIVTLSVDDLMQLCLLHYFDMYIVFDMHDGEERNSYVMDCYEFHTSEPPNRGIINQYLEDMLMR